MALLAATRYVKGLIYLMEEMKNMGIDVTTQPKVHCTVHEDNLAALTIANVPKLRPRTRHINVMYHHYRNEIATGAITIQAIGTKDQLADSFTKQQGEELFIDHQFRVQGW